MSGGRILIADDNKSVLNALSILLTGEFEFVETISNPNLLLHELDKGEFDVILLDMNFRAGENSGNEGIFWLREIRKKFLHTEVVLFTAYGDVELAVKALREGAFDFILKPWDNEKLLATLRAALRLRNSVLELNKWKKKDQALRTEFFSGDEFLPGNSPGMRHMMEMVKKVARTNANVLITGENGTGKELIAREIHKRSVRKEELLLTVDLGAIHENLFESELFGHKKGAFTDAREDRTGKFVLADKGSLFLDEIGNLPLHLQSKLLSVLQKRVVTPVGSNQEYPVDIRLISATNRNLEKMVKEKLFREDLLYRINTILIEVPPLRERQEDIEQLAHHFLLYYAKKYNKSGLKMNAYCLNKIKKYPWPGNVRELQHAMEKAVILTDQDIIGSEFFPSASLELSNGDTETLVEMEKKMIQKALDRNKGHLSLAAKQLGVTRQTLYNKLKKYEL
jgi:DNA-binding NtrC family response regulator